MIAEPFKAIAPEIRWVVFSWVEGMLARFRETVTVDAEEAGVSDAVIGF
ncbi:hypothetical protein [Halomonas sp. PA16-9]